MLPTTSVPSAEEYHLHWPNPDTHPHDIGPKVEKALSKLQASYMHPSTMPSRAFPDLAHCEVLVFPIIQAGQFGIREEEQCLSMLFNHLSTNRPSVSFNPSMDLTSGYFGLYKPYQDLILRSSIHCRIIAASPKVDFGISFLQRPLMFWLRRTGSMDLVAFQVEYLMVILFLNNSS